MRVHLKLLGCELKPEIPGYRMYSYWAQSESGMMDVIRDEDYVPDGDYEVDDDFFDKHCETTLEEAEW